MLICTVYVDGNDSGLAGSPPQVEGQLTVRLETDSELFDRMARLKPHPLNARLVVGETSDQAFVQDTDGVGCPLTYVRGRALRRLRAPRSASLWNKVAVKVLNSLPEGVVAVLYWEQVRS